MSLPTVIDLPIRISAADPDDAPTTPVEVQAAEVRRIGHLMEQDKEKFLAVHVPESWFETPEALALLLEGSDGHWSGVKHLNPAMEAWQGVASSIYDRREQLLVPFSVAFNGRADLIGVLDAIHARHGYKKMLIDITRLVELGRLNSALLTAVGFDLADLDAAEAFVHECATLYADSRHDGTRRPEAIARDKAKAYAEDWLQEARKLGKKVNRGDAGRVGAYADSYQRIRNKGRDTTATPPAGIDPKTV